MELEHFTESDAQRKVQQLNQFAGYSRFSAIPTPIPGSRTSTLRDSWSPKGRRLRHDDLDEEYDPESDVEHYGVLGMKWGVRKDPDRAYSKSINKLKSLESKRERSSIGVAKSDLKTAKKYERRAAKYTNKAAKLQSKSSIAGRSDSKMEMKARRLRMKATKAWTAKGMAKRLAKAEMLEWKSSKKRVQVF